jgi:hypothetical protein
MAVTNWKVKIFKAHTPAEIQKTGKHAEHIDNLGVTASGTDAARKLAREALERQGYRVRSISFASQEAKTMYAYVETKKKP